LIVLKIKASSFLSQRTNYTSLDVRNKSCQFVIYLGNFCFI